MRTQDVRVELIDRPGSERMYYYTPDGRRIGPLPTDAYHIKRYMARGLTLKPPKPNMTVLNGGLTATPEPTPPPLGMSDAAIRQYAVVPSEFQCLEEGCEFKGKNKRSLLGHTGWHKTKGSK